MREIPKISYSLQDLPSEYSENRWTLDPKRVVLLLHDYQKFFFKHLTTNLQEELVTNTNLVIDWAIKHNIPTVLSGQIGYGERLERGILRDLWGPGMTNEAKDTDFIDSLRKDPSNHEIIKQRYSAFAATNLESILRASRRDQLVICGVYGSVGITATAFDCVNKDIQSFLVADAIADFDAVHHTRTVRFLSQYSSDLVYSGDFSQVGEER